MVSEILQKLPEVVQGLKLHFTQSFSSVLYTMVFTLGNEWIGILIFEWYSDLIYIPFKQLRCYSNFLWSQILFT